MWIILRGFVYNTDMPLIVKAVDLPNTGDGQIVKLIDKEEDSLMQVFDSADNVADVCVSPSGMIYMFKDCVGPFSPHELSYQGPQLVCSYCVSECGRYVSLKVFSTRWRIFIVGSAGDAMKLLFYFRYLGKQQLVALVTYS